MKKIYTLAAFVLVAATSFAQRNVDLALNLTTPVDGSTVAPSSTQSIVFNITRTGDLVEVGDTIEVGYLNFRTGTAYAIDGTANSVSIFVANAQVVSFFNGANPIPSTALGVSTFNTSAAGFMLGDTIAIYVDIRTNATNPGEDGNFSNNIGAFKLGNTAGVSTVEKIDFTAFPNPAISELTIKSTEEVVSLKIMNMEGKVISTTTGNNINVSFLNSGVYFYEATTITGATVINKFVKK